VNHYYLVASLPTLTFGEKPPFTLDRFRSMVHGVLTPEEERDLALVLDGRDGGSDAFVDEWREASKGIELAVVKGRIARACRLGEDCPQEAGVVAGYAGQRVEAAFEMETPLETELEIDRVRWLVLDELTRLAPFAFKQILAYAVRLFILERWAAMREEEGLSRVEEFVDAAGETARAHEAFATHETRTDQ
jgi:hypothetical protein